MQNSMASENSSPHKSEKSTLRNIEKPDAFSLLEASLINALENYSNVHRGSGHNSIVTSYLYDRAREIVLEYLGLKTREFVVIFCTPARAASLISQIPPASFQSVSGREIGLPVGVTALAVKKKELPRGTPSQTGGGTTRLVSPDWVIWANAPERFEAGTPAIINVIAFARALQLVSSFGQDAFRNKSSVKLSVSEMLYHDDLDQYSGRKLLDEIRHTMIGCNHNVPTVEGAKPYIHLDNSASTPAFLTVWNAFCKTLHQPAMMEMEIINETRSICAETLGAPLSVYDIYFTSNATEAINLAAENLNQDKETGAETVILNTILEHTSNDLPWRMVSNNTVIRLQVDDDGFVDLNELETILCEYNRKGLHGKKRIRLMAVSGASNVLGIFNNLEEISRIVHKYDSFLLVDAAQMVAHRKVEMERTGIDYLAFSAHKVYAPFGTGVLVARKGLMEFSPDQYERIRLSGEENSAGIAALGKALILLQRIGMDVIREEEQALTGRLLRGLSKIRGLRVYGVKDPESTAFLQKGGVIVFSLERIMSNRVARELAVRSGIGVRYGCHCAHILIKHLVGVGPGLSRFQRVIATLFPKLRFPGLVRVSLGLGNSEEDVDTLIREVDKIARHPETMENKEIKQQISDFVRVAEQNVYGKL